MKELTVKQFIELVNNGQWHHREDDDCDISTETSDPNGNKLSDGYVNIDSRFDEYMIDFTKSFSWNVYDTGSIDICGGCDEYYFKLNFKILNDDSEFDDPYFDKYLDRDEVDELCFKVLPDAFKDVTINVSFYEKENDDKVLEYDDEVDYY